MPHDGSETTSSALARATSSMVPNVSVCTAATAVTTPMVGLATAHSSAMCPDPRAPISTTTTSVSSGALTSVRGTPSSLLNERSLAVVCSAPPRAPAQRSLTVVLPTEPVTPMTSSGRRTRAARPRSASALPVSRTWTIAAPGHATGRSTSTAVAPPATASSMKSWPSRSATTATKRRPATSVLESMVAPSMNASPSGSPPVAAATSATVNLTCQSPVRSPRSPRSPRCHTGEATRATPVERPATNGGRCRSSRCSTVSIPRWSCTENRGSRPRSLRWTPAIDRGRAAAGPPAPGHYGA